MENLRCLWQEPTVKIGVSTQNANSVGPLTRPLSGQEPCLLSAKTDSPGSYIRYDILPRQQVYAL